MRRALSAAFGVLAVATTFLAVSAVSAAAPTARPSTGSAPSRLDLSTTQAIKQYLRSIGVDPASVVVQRGVRNYAGPRCPGKGWTCTTAKRVVQISTWSNSFECTGTMTPSNTCTIVQSSPQNNARCVQKMDAAIAVETCDITQTGTYNNAYVSQDIDSNSAPTTANTQTQNAKQVANIKQMGFSNSVDVRQDVDHALKGTAVTALTQKQDSSQIVTVCQGGISNCSTTNDGTNDSKIHQQRLGLARASGPGVVQLQDTDGGPDCSPTFPYSPNICANVEQSSATRNDSDLHQQQHLSGHAPVDATQSQLQASGGLDGHVVQPTIGNAQNTNNAHQHLTAEANGAVMQKQDPGMGCCSMQTSKKSKANIHQVGVLSATSLSAQQQLDIEGDCVSTGSCLVVSHGRINGSSLTDRCSEQADFYPAACQTVVFCETGGGCVDVVPSEFALLALGFDTLDIQNAINYVFPATLLGI